MQYSDQQKNLETYLNNIPYISKYFFYHQGLPCPTILVVLSAKTSTFGSVATYKVMMMWVRNNKQPIFLFYRVDRLRYSSFHLVHIGKNMI